MSKTVLDNFFDYGVDHRKRVIYLGSSSKGNDDENEVSYSMAEHAIKGIIALDSESDSPITLIINSPGGWVTQGMAIFDSIRMCRSHVTGLVLGEACSMATIILQACDERHIAPNACMMIHDGYELLEGKPEDVHNYARFQKKVQKTCEDIYLCKIKERHPRFTRTKLKELLRVDTWLTSKEAMELGLVDKILESRE